MLHIWTRYTHWGVNSLMSFSMTKRVVLSNMISAVLVVMMAFLMVIFLGLENYAGDLVLLAGLLCLLVVPFFNRWGWTNGSRLTLSIGMPVLVLVFSLVSKTSVFDSIEHSEYYFPRLLLLGALVIPLILFHLNERTYLGASIAVNLICLFGFDFFHESFEVGYDIAIEGQERYFLTNIIALISVVLVLSGFLFLQRMNNAFEKRTLDLLEELKRNNRALAESSKQLEAARQKAIENSQSKELFFSNMSHELRTPMNAVIGVTNLLMEEGPKPSQMQYLKTLKFSAGNLLNVINDILDHSKIEAGKLHIEELEFNPRDLVEAVSMALQPQAAKKGLQIKTHLSDHLPERLIGDPNRLTQILNNLISNALKFTEKGMVSLGVKVEKSGVESVLLGFYVRDTGIGIPKDKLDSIFVPFAQAEESTSRKFGGTGLGLPITKKLIEMQGGQIKVESQLGEGSQFSFYLPFTPVVSLDPPKEIVEKPVIKKERGVSDLKVLVVEDNEFNLLVVGRFLDLWKVNWESAGSGEEAYEIISKKPFDLVLMDIQLPDMDGFEATKKFREHPLPRVQKVVTIAMTASVPGQTEESVKEAGLDGYIGKPFEPEDLLEKLQALANQPSNQV